MELQSEIITLKQFQSFNKSYQPKTQLQSSIKYLLLSGIKSFRLKTLQIMIKNESNTSKLLIAYKISLERTVGNSTTKSKEIVYIG